MGQNTSDDLGDCMKFKKGKLYYVEFLDHCMGMQAPMKCKVVGWVMKDDPAYVVLTPWLVDDLDEEIVEANSEPIVLLKRVILETVHLPL